MEVTDPKPPSAEQWATAVGVSATKPCDGDGIAPCVLKDGHHCPKCGNTGTLPRTLEEMANEAIARALAERSLVERTTMAKVLGVEVGTIEAMVRERDAVTAENARVATKAILDLNRDVERARMLQLGSLAILVEQGVISSGRARELGEMRIPEQRESLRALLDGEG